MVSYFVTISTNIKDDKLHKNKCCISIEPENINIDRALILLPTFKEQYLKN